jgi:hypothetical protein
VKVYLSWKIFGTFTLGGKELAIFKKHILSDISGQIKIKFKILKISTKKFTVFRLFLQMTNGKKLWTV